MISRTTKSFWKHFDALPPDVKRLAIRNYEKWRSDPAHPSLRFKCINEPQAVFSVRIGLHWRAIGYRDHGDPEDTMTWFWIGSHADYDGLIDSL